MRLKGKLSPDDGTLLWANYLAWILATNPDGKLRNGAEAVDWAKRVCEQDGYKQPQFLDTLAAAQAEAGQFADAVKTCEKLIPLAADDPAFVESAPGASGTLQGVETLPRIVRGANAGCWPCPLGRRALRYVLRSAHRSPPAAGDGECGRVRGELLSDRLPRWNPFVHARTAMIGRVWDSFF